MTGAIVAWVPWLLAAASLGWVEAQLWPDGGLWLIVLWTAVLLVFRGMVSMANERRERLVVDLVFAGLCVLAAFEGGWYVLPAAAAFALSDAAGLRIRLPALPHDARGHEVRLALAATFAGWAGLAISVSGPIYSSASSAIQPDGSVVTTQSPEPLLESGVAPPLAGALIVVAVLFLLVTLSAAVHLRSGRAAAWLAVAGATGTLVVAVALIVGALGLSLVPGVALAAAAAFVDRPSGIAWRRPRRAV